MKGAEGSAMAVINISRGRKSVSLAMSAVHKPKELNRLAYALSDVAHTERWKSFSFFLITDGSSESSAADERAAQLTAVLDGHLSNSTVLWQIKIVTSSSLTMWTELIADAVQIAATDMMVDSKVWEWTTEEFRQHSSDLPPKCRVWIVDKNGRKSPFKHSHSLPKGIPTRFGGETSSSSTVAELEYQPPWLDTRQSASPDIEKGQDMAAESFDGGGDSSPAEETTDSESFYPPSALPLECTFIGGPSGNPNLGSSGIHHSNVFSQGGVGRRPTSHDQGRDEHQNEPQMFVPWDEDSAHLVAATGEAVGGTESPTGSEGGETISIDIEPASELSWHSDGSSDDDEDRLSGIAWNILPGNCVVEPKAYYGIFISYRFSSDNFHAELLYHRLKERIIALRRQRKMSFRFFIFLDIKSLRLAEQWRQRLFQALSQSCLFLPLISHEGVADFGNEERVNAGEDNLLLEYERGLQLAQEGLLEIVPLLVKSLGAAQNFSRYILPQFPQRAQTALDKLLAIQGRHLSMEEDMGLINELSEKFLSIVRKDQERSVARMRPPSQGSEDRSMTIAEMATLGSGPRDHSFERQHSQQLGSDLQSY